MTVRDRAKDARVGGGWDQKVRLQGSSIYINVRDLLKGDIGVI